MKQKEIITRNTGQTKKLGENLAKKILKSGIKKTAVVLALQGELGSGKTTFLQGFAKGLKVKNKITSPTFVIYKKFLIYGSRNFYHFDFYRLQRPKEILDLGFKEIILNPKNIVAIEWPEKIKKILPKSALVIKFEFINEKTRKLTTNKFDKVF